MSGTVERDPPGSVPHLYLQGPFPSIALRTDEDPRGGAERTTADSPDRELWAATLLAELHLRSGGHILTPELQSLLVGGGSPALPGTGLTEAVDRILRGASVESVSEWTVELNPGAIDPDTLSAWGRAGVNRPSLRLHSTEAGALRWLGVGHGEGEARASLRAIREAGFPTWNVDLLVGLPWSVAPDPLAPVRSAVAAGAPHLTIEEFVPASERLPLTGDPVDGDERAEILLAVAAFLESEGYEPWELTSFARPGHRPRHLPAILRGAPVVGLGPGAHSRLAGGARWNLRDWTRYLNSVQSGIDPLEGEDRPGTEERRLEDLWSSLRTTHGLDVRELNGPGREAVRRWTGQGWARLEGSRVRLTIEGWLRLDRCVLELEAALDPASSPRREFRTETGAQEGEER